MFRVFWGKKILRGGGGGGQLPGMVSRQVFSKANSFEPIASPIHPLLTGA